LLALQLLQHLRRVLVVTIQHQALLVALDRPILLAHLHVTVAEAVILVP
jgi:hypothetical protein